MFTYYQQQQGSSEGGDVKPLCQHVVPGPMSHVADHLQKTIDWDWIHSMLVSQKYTGVQSVHLEAGTKDALLPARYATQDEFLLQMSGRRRIVLISPKDAFEGMYPYPTAHSYDTMSMVDLERIDSNRWPGLQDVVLHKAVVGPGDFLFIPAYWFVHVQDLEESVSLRLYATSHKRVPNQEATLLRLSRALEEQVADVVGVADVKRWLRIISRGQEHQILNLGTVDGYKKARMCQDVRDDMEQSLGESSWATMLPQVCANRLEPTPWLNENFREPLLLTDKPIRLEDTRTEEEKKYPTLFRQKLQKEGWQVEATKSTVPIPGVNIPENVDYRTI